ncbi:MAG: cysteine synthase A [Candidatus Fimadaptatus sp.]|jgi:cysteine synthase A
MAIYKNILDTIGGTPLVELNALALKAGAGARILAKLEARNPGGSAKDRAALYMIRAAESAGTLKKGMLLVEPTSGNTGVGLALAAAVLGYQLVLVMPDTMSIERRKLAAAYGARIVLTPGALGMRGAVEEAERIAREENGFIPDQFNNPANAQAHYDTTAREILADMAGEPVAAFVSAVGTGGTLTGIGRALREADAGTRIVAVEPAESPLLSGGKAGPHGIQGIGANFVPGVLDRALIDEVMTVKTEDALETARMAARTEGVLCGISSGAALAAALRLGARSEYAGRTIVTVLPDTGERYLSTALFGE